MARSNEIKLNLASVDELFSTEESRAEAKLEKVINIKLDLIIDFTDQPFQVRDNESMEEMIKSIKEYGVLTPAIVREKESIGTSGEKEYELISGHRRKHACLQAGITEMPAIVRNMSRDEAIIYMIDSNLQREQILPSEKAFAYKMKLDAMRRKQGERTDLTSVPLGQKLEKKTSRALLAENSSDSNTQIQRYIRLTELVPEILQMVDESKIALRPAVELSYLAENEQRVLLETMECEERTPSVPQAMKMKEFSKNGKLNDDVILSIITEEKPNQKEQFKMPKERISKYFAPGTPLQKIQDTIVKALEHYRKRQRDMENER